MLTLFVTSVLGGIVPLLWTIKWSISTVSKNIQSTNSNIIF